MFTELPVGLERLALQPIVIPRGFGTKEKRLHFYIVFAFVREGAIDYHPCSQRVYHAVELPTCLTDEVELPQAVSTPASKGGAKEQGCWPKQIVRHLQSGRMAIRIHEGEDATKQVLSETDIRVETPVDLQHSGWTLDQADDLWKRLMQPAAREAQVLAQRVRAGDDSPQFVSLLQRSQDTVFQPTEFNPEALKNAIPDPWAASDLRPGLRAESINTRKVVIDVQKFVSHPAGPPSGDHLTLLMTQDAGLLKFVQERDDDLWSLLRSLQRPPAHDPHFHQTVLPAIKETASFRAALTQLISLRNEFLLGPSRSEFLRQTRFVDSSRHRAPDSNAATSVSFLQQEPKCPTFEEQLARLRQHPGLMRRLYLSIKCSIPWKSAPLKLLGNIGLYGDIAELPLVCLATRTYFSFSGVNEDAHFRPAPSKNERKHFFGKKDAEHERNFHRWHTLSTELFQATQDDPSQSMLRASQAVSDAFQHVENSRQAVPHASTFKASLKKAAAKNELTLDQVPHRTNAINIYHGKANGTDDSIAKSMIERISTDLARWGEYNDHVREVVTLMRAKPEPFSLVSLNAAVAAVEPRCKSLFYAENLMQGYSVFVQGERNSQKDIWRSLNRRMVRLKIGNYLLDFEEEGSVATSVTIPPRPLVGRVKQVDDNHLTLGLLATKNQEETDESFTIVKPPVGNSTEASASEPVTKFTSALTLFNRQDQLDHKPFPGDVVLLALRGRKQQANQSHPREIEETFTYPVLRDLRDPLVSRIDEDQRFNPFISPVILKCVNGLPYADPDKNEQKQVRERWLAPIVFAPHFCRLVDHLGNYLELKGATAASPNRPKDDKPRKFRWFTAETTERNFAQVLGEVKSAIGNPQFAMTPLGPLNQVLPAHVNRKRNRVLRIPNPRLKLVIEDEIEKLDPLQLIGPDIQISHSIEVAYSDNRQVHAVRGWVRDVGFIFVIRPGKAEGKQHSLTFKPATGPIGPEHHWRLSRRLVVPWKGQNKPVEIEPLEWDAKFLPNSHQTTVVVIRGSAQLKSLDGDAPKLVLAPTSIEIAEGAALETGGSDLRWTMEMERVEGGRSVVHYDVDEPFSADFPQRVIHPLHTKGRFVEVITDRDAPSFLANGSPQYLFGTIPAGTNSNGTCRVLFPDGNWMQLPEVVASGTARYGFIQLIADNFVAGEKKNKITLEDVSPESMLIAGEVSYVKDGEVQLTDAHGHVWRIIGQFDLDLPMPVHANSVRKLRHLLLGEWLAASCYLVSGPDDVIARQIQLETEGNLAKAQTFLWGRLKEPYTPALAQAAEGETSYRPCSYRSAQDRELTVWFNSPAAVSPNELTGWSQRLVLATTLTQYEIPSSQTMPVGDEFSIGMLADDIEEPELPHHFMFSELLARWANWSLGLPQPGRADEERTKKSHCDLHYEIELSRPRLDHTFRAGESPFDIDHWKLPPLRFDRNLRICLRRVDLAGNHLYDETELPQIPPTREIDFASEPQSLVDNTSRRFCRANLPLAPIVAFTPEHLESALTPQPESGANPSLLPIVPAPVGAKPGNLKELAKQFLYLPSPARELALVLLTDVLDPSRVIADDAILELLPPPIDVETMLMHGCLDHLPPHQAAELISRFERYHDLLQNQVLGRMRDTHELNYLPDPMACQLSITIQAPLTDPKCVPAKPTHFFHAAAHAPTLHGNTKTHWPHVRWLRLALGNSQRLDRKGYEGFPLPEPIMTGDASGNAISIRIPPGITGAAVLSVRPPDLDEFEYERMVRDHGSDQRSIRLVHATNGTWKRPIWIHLAEAPHDSEVPAETLRELRGSLQIDRLTTGACSANAYWNDPWDEHVPAQHEPAKAVVYVKDGKAVSCELLEKGFGFGSQAIVCFEPMVCEYRRPVFRAWLKNCELASLETVDPGFGCNVLFHVYVSQDPSCYQQHSVRAEAMAWHDEQGKLHWKILVPGKCLGPRVSITVVAERTSLPQVDVELADGIVTKATLSSAGNGHFTGDLCMKITRRPPFYRIAEGKVDQFHPWGGIKHIDVTCAGGWYATVPHCIAHDPAGDGFGAELQAKLDEYGGVIKVEVLNPGRSYSLQTQIRFYNQLATFPEQEVIEPTAETLETPLEFNFEHRFENAHARRVDYFALAISRFRRYLRNPSKTEMDEFRNGAPMPVQCAIPRLTPCRQLEIQSHARPDKPEIRYLLPAFEWEVALPKDQPDIDPHEYFATRDRGSLHLRRDARIRVYLERPWHGTGAELLAVVVAPSVTNTTYRSSNDKLNAEDEGVFNPHAAPGDTIFSNEPVRGYAIDDNLRALVTRWGYDPVWNEKAFPPVTLDHFQNRNAKMIYDHLSQTDYSPSDKVTFRRPLWLALHNVHFDHVKDLWYSDIAIDVSGGGPVTSALPFIRLSLARYQENGLPGKRLSPVTLCDMYKMLGRRELKITRDERKFEVLLFGEFDQKPDQAPFPKREVIVLLEARDPSLSADVVHYAPPGSAFGPGKPTTAVIDLFRLNRTSPDTYQSQFELSEDALRSAASLNGQPSVANLSVLEYEIFPASESQADSTGTEVLILEGQLCARRLVYSSTFRISKGDIQP